MTAAEGNGTPDPALRALAHPVRLRMLSLMWAAPFGATGLAAALGIGHGLATQHLRQLVDTHLVEPVEARPPGGGRERLFQTVRGRVLSDRDDDAPLLAEALASNLRHRSHRRLPGPGVTVDADLWITPAVWDRFRTDLAALTDDLHQHAQPPSARDAVPVALTVMAFRMGPDATTPDTAPTGPDESTADGTDQDGTLR